MNIFSTIGNTPTVTLERVSSEHELTIYAKLEFYNPTGSLKDRIYYGMIADAEAHGRLRKGMTVLECSTGNAGIACAFMAARRGLACVIVMPEGMSEERKKIIRAYGADIIFTPGGESDVDMALAKVEELRRADPEKYWTPHQFTNPVNVQIHYATTGPELWKQTHGEIDALVLAAGTGGSLTGIGRYLREKDRRIELYAVEPDECAILTRNERGPHAIEGIGDGFVPELLDVSLLTGVITVSSEEALTMARRLIREEGIFCGPSSGANVAAALKLAKTKPVKKVATLINDGAERYFSTTLFDAAKDAAATSPQPVVRRDADPLVGHRSAWTLIA